MKPILCWKRGLFLLCAAALLFCAASCSERKSVPAPSLPPTPPAPSAPPDLSRDGRFSDQFEIWNSYCAEMRKGEFEKARQTWKKLLGAFPDEASRKSFFQSVLPDASRRLIRVVRICESCALGKCHACGGNGVCPECKSTLKCGSCGGRKQIMGACANCVCKVCRGTGFCTKCLGGKILKCPECGGTGRIEKGTQVPCDRCKGTGKYKMQGFDGQTVQVCAACNGAAFFPRQVSKECLKCAGKGTLACAACDSTGLCKGCGGKKRVAGCQFCQDKGSIVTPCARCLGTGKCVLCQGWGKCGLCEGSGTCGKCRGAQYYPLAEYVANSQWLRLDSGCLVQRAAAHTVGDIPLKPQDAGSAWGAVPAADCKSLRRKGSNMVFQPGPREVMCVCDGASSEWVSKALLK